GRTVGEVLLEPTRIYVKPVLDVLRQHPGAVHALAHITGEGLPGNVPRVLPPGCRVVLKRGSWEAPPVFAWLQRLGEIEQGEMDTVFNQGIGFILVVRPEQAEAVRCGLQEAGVPAYRIGEVRAGEPGVEFA